MFTEEEIATFNRVNNEVYKGLKILANLMTDLNRILATATYQQISLEVDKFTITKKSIVATYISYNIEGETIEKFEYDFNDFFNNSYIDEYRKKIVEAKVQKEKNDSEKAKVQKIKQEEIEREIYERLKKKFEGRDS